MTPATTRNTAGEEKPESMTSMFTVCSMTSRTMMTIDVIPKGIGSKAHSMRPSRRIDSALPAVQLTPGAMPV